ncbi:unnamed protein product [Adineta steineri]|uniref:G-protein coupled receptors family 1 profile domain-containing protein n=1 Tax=Adineta steineri TaxID=433720 RepID=A0A816CCQ8_9BILA|nr:unnamed protein product [Adineta steineri]CAF1619834.1 unnamed protein product [Adineta steineri]
MIQSGFVNTDPGAYSVMFCKIVWFSLYPIRGLSSWLIVLACGDRYLSSSTSATKRAWSTVRVANRIIPLTVLTGFIIYIHVPIFFEISIIPATQQPICYAPGPPGTYRLVLSLFNLIYFGLSPSLSMFLLGMLTLRNIERSKRLLVAPLNNLSNQHNQNNKQINRHMLRMLFLQVLMYCVTGSAYSVGAIYTAIRTSQPSNVFQVAQYNMITVVLGLLSNNGPCLSFYLFTLSSGLFRKELKKLFTKFNPTANDPQQIQTRLHQTGYVGMTTRHQ